MQPVLRLDLPAPKGLVRLEYPLTKVYSEIKTKVVPLANELEVLESLDYQHPNFRRKLEAALASFSRLVWKEARRAVEERKHLGRGEKFARRLAKFQEDFGHPTSSIESRKRRVVPTCVTNALAQNILQSALGIHRVGVLVSDDHIVPTVKLGGTTYVLENRLGKQGRAVPLRGYFKLLHEARNDERHPNYGYASEILPQRSESSASAAGRFRYYGGVSASLAAANDAIGIDLSLMGLHEEAVRHFQRAVELNPLEPSFATNYADELKEQGMNEEAVRVLRESIERNPLHDYSHNTLGHVHMASGNFGKALESFNAALKINRGNAEHYAGVGSALSALGRHRAANKPFQQAMKLAPGDAKIQELIKESRRKSR